MPSLLKNAITDKIQVSLFRTGREILLLCNAGRKHGLLKHEPISKARDRTTVLFLPLRSLPLRMAGPHLHKLLQLVQNVVVVLLLQMLAGGEQVLSPALQGWINGF